jgi:hypothetical protein
MAFPHITAKTVRNVVRPRGQEEASRRDKVLGQVDTDWYSGGPKPLPGTVPYRVKRTGKRCCCGTAVAASAPPLLPAIDRGRAAGENLRGNPCGVFFRRLRASVSAPAYFVCIACAALASISLTFRDLLLL